MLGWIKFILTLAVLAPWALVLAEIVKLIRSMYEHHARDRTTVASPVPV